MSRKTDAKAIAKLDALYATLPTIACRGLCAVACSSVPMSTLEAKRLRKADAQRRLPMIREDLSCIYLTKSQRCAVYAARPLICRVWGTVKRMSCMHGCVPDRWLSDHEFVEVGKAIERVGGSLVVSALEGLSLIAKGFLDLDTSTIPEELAEQLAERTRSLRALHGGRIVGVTPTPANAHPGWIYIDKASS
jgi:Fe-S-cluster containining protein